MPVAAVVVAVWAVTVAAWAVVVVVAIQEMGRWRRKVVGVVVRERSEVELALNNPVTLG
jgi:hypothetical protein